MHILAGLITTDHAWTVHPKDTSSVEAIYVVATIQAKTTFFSFSCVMVKFLCLMRGEDDEGFGKDECTEINAYI